MKERLFPAVIGLLVAACSSAPTQPPPSPTPTVEPSPTPSPTSSTVEFGVNAEGVVETLNSGTWNFVEFEDGLYQEPGSGYRLVIDGSTLVVEGIQVHMEPDGDFQTYQGHDFWMLLGEFLTPSTVESIRQSAEQQLDEAFMEGEVVRQVGEFKVAVFCNEFPSDEESDIQLCSGDELLIGVYFAPFG